MAAHRTVCLFCSVMAARTNLADRYSRVLMPDIRRMRELIKPSGTDSGDGNDAYPPPSLLYFTFVGLTRGIAISAIVVAIDLIRKYCKRLKYKRKIILVTNAQGKMDSSGMDEIVKKIREEDIELVIL